MRGVTLVDDYGHHPIRKVAPRSPRPSLSTSSTSMWFSSRIATRVSRLLCDDFVDAFADADTVILVDVFPAAKCPSPVLTSKMLADKIRAAHPGKSVYYVTDHAALMARIDDVAQAGDLLITMAPVTSPPSVPSISSTSRTRQISPWVRSTR